MGWFFFPSQEASKRLPYDQELCSSCSKIRYGKLFQPEETHHSLCQLSPVGFLCVGSWIREAAVC